MVTPLRLSLIDGNRMTSMLYSNNDKILKSISEPTRKMYGTEGRVDKYDNNNNYVPSRLRNCSGSDLY